MTKDPKAKAAKTVLIPKVKPIFQHVPYENNAILYTNNEEQASQNIGK